MEAMRFELLVIGLFHHGITAMSSTWTVAGFGFIRGKTANWTPPKKTRTAKLQTKELPKLLSASCWYYTTTKKTVPAKVIDIENK
jgi:hypothetical protein